LFAASVLLVALLTAVARAREITTTNAAAQPPRALEETMIPEAPAVLLFGVGGLIIRWQFRRRQVRLATG
jgi:hypothetical protein